MTTGEADTANAPTGATPEATITATPQPEGTQHAFQADVARLLHLMVHSVYSERDIFLRELISNAADACEKLRYEALAEPSLVQDGQPFGITIAIDKDAKTLSVSDNGVGMSEDDLIGALGSIASSGTRAFLDKLAAGNNADKSKRRQGRRREAANLAGPHRAVRHRLLLGLHGRRPRRGRHPQGRRRLRPSLDLGTARAPMPSRRSTSIARRCAAPASCCTSTPKARTTWRRGKIEGIVREHSGAIAVPIDLLETPGDEPRKLSEGVALWTKPKSAVTPEEYKEFLPHARRLRRAGADGALARRGPPRIHRAGVRAFDQAVRPVRPAAQGQGQALRAPRADLVGRRDRAELAALREARRRLGRPPAQRVARADPGELGLRRDQEGRRQPHRAGAGQVRRERQGWLRQGVGHLRRRHQGRPLRGSRAPRRDLQDGPVSPPRATSRASARWPNTSPT